MCKLHTQNIVIETHIYKSIEGRRVNRKRSRDRISRKGQIHQIDKLAICFGYTTNNIIFRNIESLHLSET